MLYLRYGFNGQEKDDEIYGAGNTMTAEFWEYDTRLGRRFNIDPVVKPWESSYAVFSDNPIYFSDPSGADGEPVNKGDGDGKKGSGAVNGGTKNGDGSVSGGNAVCLGCGKNGENTYGIPKDDVPGGGGGGAKAVNHALGTTINAGTATTYHGGVGGTGTSGTSEGGFLSSMLEAITPPQEKTELNFDEVKPPLDTQQKGGTNQSGRGPSSNVAFKSKSPYIEYVYGNNPGSIAAGISGSGNIQELLRKGDLLEGLEMAKTAIYVGDAVGGALRETKEQIKDRPLLKTTDSVIYRPTHVFDKNGDMVRLKKDTSYKLPANQIH